MRKIIRPNRVPLTITLIAGYLALVASGCDNPADHVPHAAVKEAGQESLSEATGRAFNIHPDSTIGFIGSKVTGSHQGGFTNFSGMFHADSGRLIGPQFVEIDLHSTWTDTDRLTAHLKSEDFFDVNQFPTAKFTVTGIETQGAQTNVTGNLELHGIAKSITFPAAIDVQEDRITVQTEFAINRKDFDINYPGKPNDLIRDDVVIQLDIEAYPAEDGTGG